MLDIFEGGKDYISASRAAKLSGYSSDYIGQLCRAKKITGQLIGRTWFVDYSALLEHKRNRQNGKQKKVEVRSTQTEQENSIARDSTETRQTDFLRVLQNDDPFHLLPPLSKAGKYVPPIWTKHHTREAVLVSLSLVLAISIGFATLEKTSPIVSRALEQKIETLPAELAGDLTAASALAQISFFDFILDAYETLLSGFSDLKNFALRKIFLAKKEQETSNKIQTTSNVPITQATPNSAEAPLGKQTALTESTPSLDFSSIKSNLRAELESYLNSRLSSLEQPINVYQTINPVELRREILLADTRPTITRQSDADAGSLSGVVSSLTNGGRFSNAVLTDSTISGSGGSLTEFTFTNATGTTLLTTTASSTTFYSNTSTIATLNITGNASVGGSLTVSGSTVTVGQLLSTRVPTLAHVFTTWPAGTSNVADATIYINPASAGADTNIFGAAVAGSVKFLVDAEGDIYGNNLILSGSTSQGATTIAGNLTVQDSVTLGDAATDTATSTAQFLALASTTLQHFTFRSATGTSATTTDLYVSNLASTTSFRTNTGIIGNLTVSSCAGCGIPWMFTKLSTDEQATSTTPAFLNGFLSTASSTLASTTATSLLVTTSATSTNLYSTNFLVSGSSTLQSLSATYASSTQLQSTSNSYFATDNGAVGIGTTTPAWKLQVSNTAAPQLTLSDSGLITSNHWAFRNSNGQLYIASSSATTLATSTIATLTIDGTTGSIGVGTTSPSSFIPFQIAATGRPQLLLTDSGAIASRGFSLRNSNGMFYIATSSPTSFATSTTAAFTLDGRTGNVGIGTTGPGYKLEVNGTLKSNSWTDTTNTISTFGGRTTFRKSSAGVTEFVVSSNGTQTQDTAVLKVYGSDYGADTSNGWEMLFDGCGSSGCPGFTGLTNTANSGILTMTNEGSATGFHDFIFGVQTSNAGVGSVVEGIRLDSDNSPSVKFFVDKMTIQESGNIGIGTTTPQRLLSLATSTAPQLALTDTTGGVNHWTFRNVGQQLYIATSSATSFATSTIAALTIDGATGNIGVGTSTPFWKNQISTTNAPQLALSDSGSITSNHWTFRNSNGQLYIDTASATTFATSSTAKFTIDGTNGNVGIGTTTPLGRLHVTNGGSGWIGVNTNADDLVVENGSHAGISILFPTSLGGNISFKDGLGRQALIGYESGLGYLHLDTNTAGEIIRLTDGGNVGIGTTTPQWKTQISTTAAPQLALSDSGLATANHWTFRNSNGQLYFATSSPTTYATSSATALTIDGTTGNITTVAGLNLWGIANGAGTAYLCTTLATGVVSTSTTACNPSSLKYKQNINDLSYGLQEVMSLRPVSYEYKPELLVQGHQVGFIAEDLYKIIPEVVGLKDGEPDNIDYSKLTAVLAKAIQELNQNQEALIGINATTTQSQAFATSFFDNLFARVRTWLADATNGIVEFFANRVHTKELCVGDGSGAETCITKAQLDSLLASAETSGGQGSGGESAPAPTPEPIPPVQSEAEGESAPESAPESVPEPTPEITPEPELTPEVTLAPEVMPEPEPSPDPTSTPEPESGPDIINP